MKSKGLVAVGIVLIVASVIFAFSYFVSPAVEPLSSVEAGPFKITDITEETAIGLAIFLVIFLTGVGVTVKGFI